MCASMVVASQENLRLAAQIFADEYKGEMRSIEPKDEQPPCTHCSDCTMYFCYLTEIQCRVFAVWVDEIR